MKYSLNKDTKNTVLPKEIIVQIFTEYHEWDTVFCNYNLKNSYKKHRLKSETEIRSYSHGELMKIKSYYSLEKNKNQKET